jgi:peptide/nickel transport system ATP-binding protein
VADLTERLQQPLPSSRNQGPVQDPTDSLNPRFIAVRAIADPIMQLGDIRRRDALRARCEELATLVGLPVNLLDRFPHQLSGGQKARVGIARAIALHPKLVISTSRPRRSTSRCRRWS